MPFCIIHRKLNSWPNAILFLLIIKLTITMLEWDYNKPAEMNDKTWRRIQLERYIAVNPDHKPRDVIKWLQSQSPNPWPSRDANSLEKIIRRLCKPSSQKQLTLSIDLFQSEIKPLSLEWYTPMPQHVSVHWWRRVQLQGYIDEFPDHKPKHVMSLLERNAQHPWPDCSTKSISRILCELKKT